MRLYEYEAKKIFKLNGIPIPKQYGVIKNIDELKKIIIEFPAMLKAQVLSGGRGKQGGVVKVENFNEAKTNAEKIFSLKINGYPVQSILIEEAVSPISSFYVGITMNPSNYKNTIMVSSKGGVDIEKIAQEEPQSILKKEIDNNDLVISKKEINKFLSKKFKNLTNVIQILYNIYQKYDCKLAEINPLFEVEKGVVAVDAKIVLDDNALYRQAELLDMIGIKECRHDNAEMTMNEKRASLFGFPYIDLLPKETKKEPNKLYVGLVPGGAGYGILAIDEVVNIGTRFFNGKVVPINFMDSGGGPSLTEVMEMFNLLMDNEMVDVIITSRFGGISSCDIFIRGLVQCLRKRYEEGKRIVPIYGRMVGTDLPSAKKYLEEAKAETPEPLKNLNIVVGNQMIMADVIRNAISCMMNKKTG
jgi:succinyl-CoA synthetase beta subunit